MQKRRRFKQTLPLKQRLADYAAGLRCEAQRAASVADRELLIRRARRAETASHLNDWLMSPGLRSST